MKKSNNTGTKKWQSWDNVKNLPIWTLDSFTNCLQTPYLAWAAKLKQAPLENRMIWQIQANNGSEISEIKRKGRSLLELDDSAPHADIPDTGYLERILDFS